MSSSVSRRVLARYVPIAILMSLASAAVLVHVAIRTAYDANEKSFHEICAYSLMDHRQRLPLAPAFRALEAIGTDKKKISWLMEVDGTDPVKGDVVVNGTPIIVFKPPYMVIDAQQIAAWDRAPHGVIVESTIAKRNGWKLGDTANVSFQGGTASGTIVAIVDGTSPKVVFHADYLDTFLPEALRARGRYICFPVAPGRFLEARAAVESAFEQVSDPAWVDGPYEYLASTLGESPGLRTWAALAWSSVALLFAFVAFAPLDERVARAKELLLASACASVTIAALWMHYRSGGIAAGGWFLSSVPISPAAAGIAFLVVVATVFSAELVRAARHWLPGIVVAALASGAAILMIGLFQSVAELRQDDPAVTTLLRAGDQDLIDSVLDEEGVLAFKRALPDAQIVGERMERTTARGRDLLVHEIRVRGTDAAGVTLHGASIDGALPGPGADGVVVGAGLYAGLPGLGRRSIAIGHRRWPITGVLTAPGTVFESELWCDRDALAKELGPKPPSVLAVRNVEMARLDSMAAGAKLRVATGVVPPADPYRGTFWCVLVLLALTSAVALTGAASRGAPWRAAALPIALCTTVVVIAAHRYFELGSPWIEVRTTFGSRASLLIAGFGLVQLVAIFVGRRLARERA